MYAAFVSCLGPCFQDFAWLLSQFCVSLQGDKALNTSLSLQGLETVAQEVLGGLK